MKKTNLPTQASRKLELGFIASLMRLIRFVFDYVFKEAYQKTNQASATFLANPDAKKPDKTVISVFILAAVSLTLFSYFGSISFAINSLNNLGLTSFGDRLANYLSELADPKFFSLRYWVWVNLVCYFILPALAIKFILKQNLKDYGLSFRSVFKEWKLYLAIYSLMLLLVSLVSMSQEFQTMYPFYKPQPLMPKFLFWHLHYLVLFFSVEFFFRGFLLHGLKHRFGFYSIFMMTLPYCMIHYGKPLPETLGSIFAGVVLGALSLKTNSMWFGVLIHYSIGLTMDIFSLWHQGYF